MCKAGKQQILNEHRGVRYTDSLTVKKKKKKGKYKDSKLRGKTLGPKTQIHLKICQQLSMLRTDY